MSSLRTSYWYISLYLKKHVKIIIGAILVGVLVFAGLLPFLTNLPQLKPTRYIGVIGSFNFSTLPKPIQNQISLGLTHIEEDGSASPELSQRWSIEDDGKTYRFILKNGIHWQDGKLLEPKDISFNFQDTQIITTENEIIFKLKEPFAPFPVVLSQPLFREVQTSYLRFFKRNKIIGIGSYEVTKTTYQDDLLSELILDSAAERIVYRFYLTEDRALVAYEHGKIDEIQDVSDISTFDNWPNTVTTRKINKDQYLGIFFNQNDPLFEKNVRQALSYSLTKGDPNLRTKSPISPISWAYLDGVKSYGFDLDRAMERMFDTMPQQPLNITLTTTLRFQDEAEQIKKEWENFGKLTSEKCHTSGEIKDKTLCDNTKISVTINLTNFPDVGNYQALLIGQEIPTDPDQYTLWDSTQNTNFTHYKNPRIDALLENGRKTSDQNQRKAIYQEFQQFLLEDAPAIFLHYLESYSVKRT
ncbi:MAG: ABC transporter substrate-binding protein [Patescibacteria group bacterium]